MSVIQIPQKIHQAMITQAVAAAPNECCGLLAGKEGKVEAVYPITNLPADDRSIVDLKVPEDRRFRYVMAPQEQIRAFKQMREKGTEMLVIYHSHPHSPAYPSETDIRLAYYPEVHYLIISLENKDLPHIRAFRIVDGKITEEKITP